MLVSGSQWYSLGARMLQAWFEFGERDLTASRHPSSIAYFLCKWVKLRVGLTRVLDGAYTALLRELQARVRRTERFAVLHDYVCRTVLEWILQFSFKQEIGRASR